MFTEMFFYFIHAYSNGLKDSDLEDHTRVKLLEIKSQNFISCWPETVRLSQTDKDHPHSNRERFCVMTLERGSSALSTVHKVSQ
jgi:hypothetical protein